MSVAGEGNMLEQWGMPLAVFGMLMATLVIASVANRYQVYQAEMRTRVRHIEQRLLTVSDALNDLRTVPLSRELRITLRGEVLARYQRIKRLYRKYPDITNKIAEAETALNAEGAPIAGSVGRIENAQLFRAMSKAFAALIELMEKGDSLQPIPKDVRGIFRRELVERRAEMYSRYHLVEAKRCEQSNNISGARTHLSNLMQLLRYRGPSTAFIRELYAEAERAMAELSSKMLAARN